MMTPQVGDLLPHDDPTAGHLLVVEVITPARHFSRYPPHKHDLAHEWLRKAG